MTGPRSPAKWFRALLSAFLAVTLVSPAYAASPVGSRTLPVTRPRDVSALQPGRVQTIVEASLTTALANGGKQTFLVTVRGQADVNLAADEASSRAAEQGKTPRAQRLARANAVISNLQQVSARGQSNLLPLLNQLQNDGAVSVFEQFWITNVIAVTGDATAVKALAARPEVEKITAGKTYRVMGGKSASPRAPAATTSVVPQWGATQTIEWNINQIGAPDAWALGFDGTGIVVANLDTGVESGHPALARKWRGADGSNPAYSWFDAVNHYNSGPYDDHGHGTHTMGTIAGSDEAGNNMIGVAPGARWIAAKILDSTGSGSDVGILEASQWLLAPGGDPSMAPDVVSNSWGGGAGIDEFLRPMVQAWRAAGIVPVFANGNTRNGATSCLVSVPANYPESIGVGATDSNNQVAGFSCRGPSPYGEIKPELSAPGVNVRSSVPGGSYQGGWNGTSMATPHVAGVAALLRQANASLTVDEIEQVLIETATPLTDSQYPSVPNNGYGWGLVNAFDAVASVAAGTGTVNGRVTTSGDDLESPAITHTAITEAQSGLDLPVSAQVADNVSVTEVNLYVKPDADSFYAVIPMTRSAGTFKNGTYTAAIPGALVKTPAFQYYVRATDYGGNFATTPIYPVSVIPSLTPGSGTDFESQPVGWSHGGNNDPWQWGVPTSGPNAAHSGNNVYATNLTGTYADNTNAYLATPPIDLTAATGGVKLEWYEWYELEQNYDYADVWVRDAAGGVTTVLSRTGSNTSWQLKSIDLTPWIGQTVTVLFNLRTDISIVRAGWYLDDVALTEPDSIPPAPPANLSGTATTDGLVNLSWNANTEPDLVHYRVYRSATSGSGYANVGTVTAPGFIDTTAPADVPAYYAVTAVDQWGNESGYSNEITLTPPGPLVYFFDDMEHGENGWTHGGVNDQWQHGTPNFSPVPYSGTNLWGTNLTGSYQNNADQWLMSPPITIPAGPSASLQFQHYYEIETGYDRGYVEISSDGGTSWTSLGNDFTGMSTGWVRSTYDLAAYTGQTVKVRFRLTTDFIVPWLGWYIDDVQVTNRPAITNDRAWIPTKLPTKLDVKPLYNGAKPGTYKLAIPGTGSRRYGIASLPADATVTILETNRSVHTDPATGDYSLVHAAGTYTARAEAYGYFPVDAAVTIPEGGVVSANFLLEPIPPGLLTGIVTNAQTGAPVAGARVKLLEDSHIAPVTTGADGRYSFVALPGTYTLNVSRQEYRSYTANAAVIGNLTTEHNVALEPFVAVPGELAYDDGTAESAWVSNDAGNGFGVRMTPDASRGAAVLKNASFYVWDTSWPTPGGTSYSVAVYDSSGPGGVPGQRVAGPIPATAVRGTWNTVDLSSLGLTFTNDFYVAYIFTTSYPNSPGLGSDMSQPYYDRSWQLGGGAWYKAPSDRGNWMIRATVMYEVQPPAITSPAPDSITNQTQLDVRGTSVDGATITVYNDGVAAGTGTAADGAFNVPVTLHRGTNRLTATATLPAGTTQPSADVIVTLDDIGPVLTVSSPADQSVTTREVATVTGSASDERLAGVTVNGEAAVLTNGSFSHRVLLDPGDNLLTIVASDTAGNSTTVTRHVFSDTTGPAITNVMPATDTTIRPGRPVIIAFDAEAGLTRVGYIINVATGWDGPTVSTGELTNMRETRPGHYEGTYSPPYGTSFRGAEITVWAIDSAGNRSEAVAPGKLNVISPNQPPVVRITLPSSVRANTPVTFTNTSYDPDGTISQWRWSFSDGTAATGSTVTKRFTRPGTYKVTLTATDNTGAVTTGTATVVVR